MPKENKMDHARKKILNYYFQLGLHFERDYISNLRVSMTFESQNKSGNK